MRDRAAFPMIVVALLMVAALLPTRRVRACSQPEWSNKVAFEVSSLKIDGVEQALPAPTGSFSIAFSPVDEALVNVLDPSTLAARRLELR